MAPLARGPVAKGRWATKCQCTDSAKALLLCWRFAGRTSAKGGRDMVEQARGKEGCGVSKWYQYSKRSNGTNVALHTNEFIRTLVNALQLPG